MRRFLGTPCPEDVPTEPLGGTGWVLATLHVGHVSCPRPVSPSPALRHRVPRTLQCLGGGREADRGQGMGLPWTLAPSGTLCPELYGLEAYVDFVDEEHVCILP